MNDLESTNYFSTSYREARDKFLDAANTAGANIYSIKNPNTGPNGEPLFTDIASIGSMDAKNILFLSSGTHGVEGFAGSGIQIGLLREGIVANANSDICILFVHAVNPYGFAHLRRVNEDNVDLNRNFIDHTQPYPKSPEYEQLADVIAPKSISFWSEVGAKSRILWYRLRNGDTGLQKAVSSGQYSHPKGMFYGGNFETWSNKTLQSIAQRYMTRAERVIGIDFHTGLGPFGYGEIILNDPEESAAYKNAIALWGADRVRTTAGGTSVSAHIEGTLKLAFTKMVPDAEVTVVGLEYGTIPMMEVFKALRNENWLHHYGGKDHPDAKKIKTDLLRAFYPQPDDWKDLVLNQGKEVVEQTIFFLKSI